MSFFFFFFVSEREDERRKKREERKGERGLSELKESRRSSAAEEESKQQLSRGEEAIEDKIISFFEGFQSPLCAPVRSRQQPGLTVVPRLGPIWGLGAAGAAAAS